MSLREKVDLAAQLQRYWADNQVSCTAEFDPDTEAQSVWALSPDEGAEPELLTDTGFRVDEPRISPDGRWLAYISDESGQYEVYVEPYRREGERVGLVVLARYMQILSPELVARFPDLVVHGAEGERAPHVLNVGVPGGDVVD